MPVSVNMNKFWFAKTRLIEAVEEIIDDFGIVTTPGSVFMPKMLSEELVELVTELEQILAEWSW